MKNKVPGKSNILQMFLWISNN